MQPVEILPETVFSEQQVEEVGITAFIDPIDTHFLRKCQKQVEHSILTLVHPISLDMQDVDAWLNSSLNQVAIAPLLHATSYIAEPIHKLGSQNQAVSACLCLQIR